MGKCAQVRRCLICHRATPENSSIDSENLVSTASLLQDFLNCFQINVLDSEVNDLSTSCQFCPTCEQFLAEWSSIQTQMTQLTRRAAQLKATLSALLLSAPPIPEQNHDEDVNEIINKRIQNSQEVELPLLLQQTVDDIRNDLRKEYCVNVLVDKIQLPCPPRNPNEGELARLSGLSDNDDEPTDDWRGADDSDTDYLPNEDQMDDEEISEQLSGNRIKTEEVTSSDDSDGHDSVELEEIKLNRKSKNRTRVARKSLTSDVSRGKWDPYACKTFVPDGPNRFKFKGLPLHRNEEDQTFTCDTCGFRSAPTMASIRSIKRHLVRHLKKLSPEKAEKRLKHEAVVKQDGPNTFNYHGHGLRLNDEDQCYYCSACGFKGTTYRHTVLTHIRDVHYSEEDKLKFTTVKTSDTEWIYGGVYKIVSEGEKFQCVSCGSLKAHLSYMINHIRTQHVNVKGPHEEVPLPATDTPSVNESTPTQGVYQSVPYTFHPINNKYTCGICQQEFFLRKNFARHTRERHSGKYKEGKPPKHPAGVIPDGLNTFKYNGHGFNLNFADQCYYCGTCGYKGTTTMASVLIHIRHIHYTAEDKKKFTPVKTSEGEWLYGEEYKIVAVGKQFQCVSCGNMSGRLTRLIRHIRSHHIDLERPHQGAPLPATTPSVIDSTPIQGELQSVPYTFSPADDEYTCRICQTLVGTRTCFLSHIKNHHVELTEKRNQSRCSVIPDGPNKFKYNGHGIKLKDEDQCYYCDACDFKGNTSVNSLLAHIRELHYTEEDKLKFTAVKTSDTEWLYGGVFKIIRAGEKFKCVSCGCQRFRLNELTAHIRSEHVDMEGNPKVVPFPVTDTPSVSDATPTQGVIKSVAYTFNPITNKYTCGICQVEVSTSRKCLARHIQDRHRHAGTSQKVICEICGKELSSQRVYQDHLKRHQSEPKTCPTCNKKFYCPSKLTVHMNIHVFGDAAKKYQCEYCGKRFSQRQHYAGHVRVHTGETPYECHVCGKKFRYSTDLSAHRKRDHGIMTQPRKLIRINE